MCAILGAVNKNDILNFSDFSFALNLLKHRGPDDEGIWSAEEILLGHRRLSILDLTKAGHQPMVHKKTGSVLIFNGEIYNYKELAKELNDLGYKLHGNSDTEVLLHALVEWGPEAIKRLNGMWSFAFWYPDKKELLLSRDRLGVKPLYFNNSKNGLVFALEPKAIVSLLPECKLVNEDALLNFLKNNTLYSKGESFYKEINVFPPAHYGIFNLSNKKLKLIRYWNYPQTINHNITEQDALEEFTILFEDSVTLRLRSDVPFGITLSGGIDSTSILSTVNKISKNPITCFVSHYKDTKFSEIKWAEIAANKTGSNLIPVVAKEKYWLNTLEKIAWHMDGPGYSPAVYPLWNIMERSQKENIKVLLDGQGADEALGGYPHYLINYVLDLMQSSGKQKKITTKKLINLVLGIFKTFGFFSSLAWFIREKSSNIHNIYRENFGFQSVLKENLRYAMPINSNNKNNYNVRDRLVQDHSSNILPGLLHYNDSISMAHSIEIQNPFLDYRLVEWMFKLPNHILFNKNQTKWLPREYLRNNNQDEIANRLDKKGYPTPVKKWMSNLANNEIEKLLLSKNNPLLKWCDRQKIKKLIYYNKKNMMGSDHHLYKLISAKIWMKKCLNEY